MSDNIEKELYEEKFKRMEDTINKLTAVVEKNDESIKAELDKFRDDFNSLKEDYKITKTGLMETVKNLEKMPEAFNNIEKTLIILSKNIEANDQKIDSLGVNVQNLQKKISQNEDKGKFDIMEYFKTLIPYILEAGIVALIVKLI